MSYSTLNNTTDPESGEHVPLSSKNTESPSRNTLVGFAVVLGLAAGSGFALGSSFGGPQSSTSSFVKVPSSYSKPPAIPSIPSVPSLPAKPPAVPNVPSFAKPYVKPAENDRESLSSSHTHYELAPVAPYYCPDWKAEKQMPACADAKEFDLCSPTSDEKAKPQLNCISEWKSSPHYGEAYPVYRKVNKKTCTDSEWFGIDDDFSGGVTCQEIKDAIWAGGKREEYCGAEGSDQHLNRLDAYTACAQSCDSCGRELGGFESRHVNVGCSPYDWNWVATGHEKDEEGNPIQGCKWVEDQIAAGAEPRVTCLSPGTYLNYGELTETPAYRACGRACGTCKDAK